MSTVSCIVDGQQRSNAIIRYIDNEYDVDGRCYNMLSESEKSDFLKYEIAVIELDIENDDPKVQEIFQRINRTSNSLSIIEKMASEYSTSEYMLVAKLLANEIDLDYKYSTEDLREDPNIPTEFFTWAKKQNVTKFQTLIANKAIFSSREIARKVPLMHILNIMSTIIIDFFNRNEKTTNLLDDYSLSFDERDEIVLKLEKTAELILKLKFRARSMWFNKSNAFSLIIALAIKYDDFNTIDLAKLKSNLEEFEANTPQDYKLAATEGVNNKKERELRHSYINEIINNSRSEV